MKKKVLKQLKFKKQSVATFESSKIIGGNSFNGQTCSPATFENNCRTRKNACHTQQTCLTCVAASCTPQGCGNSNFNC